ncbi:hypothetical protein D3C73_1484300 [compost metagenome]
MIEATSAEWGDAVNALTAIAALVGNKKMVIDQAQTEIAKNLPLYEKHWEWLHREEQNQLLKKRSDRVRNQSGSEEIGGIEDDV